MRKGEDHVYVAGGQEFLSARLQPAVAGLGLTLGTVPISAANGDISITCLVLNRYAVAATLLSP